LNKKKKGPTVNCSRIKNKKRRKRHEQSRTNIMAERVYNSDNKEKQTGRHGYAGIVWAEAKTHTKLILFRQRKKERWQNLGLKAGFRKTQKKVQAAFEIRKRPGPREGVCGTSCGKGKTWRTEAPREKRREGALGKT